MKSSLIFIKYFKINSMAEEILFHIKELFRFLFTTFSLHKKINIFEYCGRCKMNHFTGAPENVGIGFSIHIR